MAGVSRLRLRGNRLNFRSARAGDVLISADVPVKLEDGIKQINIPIDAVVMPKKSRAGNFPLLIEAKSAGDFTNTNKRRKEEAVKISQLRRTYGPRIQFILFLCGYFDSGYLGYERRNISLYSQITQKRSPQTYICCFTPRNRWQMLSRRSPT